MQYSIRDRSSIRRRRDNDSGPLDSGPDILRVYGSARTAHLERLAEFAPSELLYARQEYDFDLSAAPRGALISAVGRYRTLARLATRPYRVVELNEALMFRRWFDIGAQIAVIRGADMVRRRRTLIVMYCIEVLDPSIPLSTKLRVPSVLTRAVTKIAVRLILRCTDRIAFGTTGARTVYSSYAPEALLAKRSNLFEALPCPCGCVPPAGVPDAPRANKVVFLGRFDDRKGVLPLMRAWDLVISQRADARLTLIGAGPHGEAVEAFSQARPSVTLINDPPRDRIHTELRQNQVLILLSQPIRAWREQVGLPIVEALSHGCSVIASSETGLSSWLAAHGHIVLRPSADERGIATAIVTSLDSSRPSAEILRSLPLTDQRVAADRWLTR